MEQATALTRRFSDNGYRAIAIAWHNNTLQAVVRDVPEAVGIARDVTDLKSVSGAFAEIEGRFGSVDTILFNAVTGVFRELLDTSTMDFEQAWRVNAMGAFLCKEWFRINMEVTGRDNFIIVCVTASHRGGKMTTAFAAAKATQRSLAESLARSL
ncbi:SDR family NAD(P)-dependent oxidoreductase [Ochrobactrum sp. GPK 3]|uniref:SDR family NAD(P)-dependent oxidoreductase n=1 Tax=Brucella/Ochrobactrum group TaxID=2826938 RepID=UPI001591E9AB|nr:NAD(P)-dependent dehydrogenase (short-subunit alcohol dehydrogenase family) [Ochrobactrum sp. P6BSIII]